MLGLAVGAGLVALGVFVGHPFVVRQDLRRIELLRPYEGCEVTLVGYRKGRYTGVLALDVSRRVLYLDQPLTPLRYAGCHGGLRHAKFTSTDVGFQMRPLDHAGCGPTSVACCSA